MIGFIELVKDNGKKAWIRPDEIASVSENETKVDGKAVPCLTILLRNNVSWHFPALAFEELVEAIKSTAGEQVNVIAAIK